MGAGRWSCSCTARASAARTSTRSSATGRPASRESAACRWSWSRRSCPRGSCGRPTRCSPCSIVSQGELRIDTTRVYLTGLSMGAYGAWELAIAAPARFAALAVVSGGGNPVEICRLKDTPVWIAHGAKDDIIPVGVGRGHGDAARALRWPPAALDRPEAGHDAWTKFYARPRAVGVAARAEAAAAPMIAVVGAGAVGSYFGGMLARAGEPVTLIGRPAARGRDPRARPAHREPGLGRARVRRAASTDLADARGADVVLLCVKTGDTAGAGRALAPHLAPGALVVSLQNGVENADVSRAAAGTRGGARGGLRRGRSSRRRATCATRARRPDPRGARGPRAPRAARGVRRDVRARRRAVRRRATTSRPRCGSSWCSIARSTRCRRSATRATARSRRPGRARGRHGRDRGGARGRAGRRDPPAGRRPRSARRGSSRPAMPQATSSTAQDLALGRRTEIDALNGYVARTRNGTRRADARQPGAVRARPAAGGARHVRRSRDPPRSPLIMTLAAWSPSPAASGRDTRRTCTPAPTASRRASRTRCGGESIRLEVGSRRWTLASDSTASGAKYTDGDVTFWSKGKAATIEQGGKPLCRDCRLVRTSSAEPEGTGGTAAADLPASIVGVEWEWVALTTPAEKLTIEEPERYTLTLLPEGRVAARLDCNRGTGRYTLDELAKQHRHRPARDHARACARRPRTPLDSRNCSRTQASRCWRRTERSCSSCPAGSGTLRFRARPGPR